MRFWRTLPIFLAFLSLVPATQAYLLVNGDFEDVKETGWSYRGENDGSHGIFSDPSNPGTYSYMLQLDGGDESGYSEVAQKIATKPGQTYRLSLDLFDSREDSNTGDRQLVTVNGLHAFSHDLARGIPETGWIQREITFRADSDELEIVIGVYGKAGEREGSTTLVDNVKLVMSGEELPPPFLKGKPLAEVSNRTRLPTSIAYGANGVSLSGYEPIQLYRQAFCHQPAMCSWYGGWDLTEANPFETTRTAIEPWIRQGVLPIVAPEVDASHADHIIDGKHDAYFQAWALAVRDWGYPIVLRPWREMDLDRLGFGPAGTKEPDEFVKMWRHVYRIFKKEGATNVLWYWTPSGLTNATKRYYPGDNFVDIVGCSAYDEWGSDVLDSYSDYHARHYRNRAFGVAEGASIKGRQAAWLSAILNGVLTKYPRLEFYTHSNFVDSASDLDYRIEHTEGAQDVYRKWLETSVAQHRLAQVTPPELDVTVFQTSKSAEVILISLGGANARPSSTMKVEFWAGHPERGGEMINEPEFVELKKGQSIAVRQDWPKDVEGKLHVLVDLSVDPHFFLATPDPSDVRIYVE